MDVLNMNTHSAHVRLKDAQGNTDFVTVQAKRRVSLPAGYTVDINWLATQPKVKTFDGAKSKTVLPLPLAVVPKDQVTSATVQSAAAKATAVISAAPAPAPTVTLTLGSPADAVASPASN